MSTLFSINELCNICTQAMLGNNNLKHQFSDLRPLIYLLSIKIEWEKNQWTSRNLTALFSFIKAHSSRVSVSGALIVFPTNSKSVKKFLFFLFHFVSLPPTINFSVTCIPFLSFPFFKWKRCPLNASHEICSFLKNKKGFQSILFHYLLHTTLFTACCIFPSLFCRSHRPSTVFK